MLDKPSSRLARRQVPYSVEDARKNEKIPRTQQERGQEATCEHYQGINRVDAQQKQRVKCAHRNLRI